MANKLLMRVLFLLVLLPNVVFAAALDDYYLARFGEKEGAARALADSLLTVTHHADRCLTPLYHDLRRDWRQLEPSTQTVLAKHLLKPRLSGESTYYSPGGHFTIHYAVSGGDAPDLTNLNQYGVPTWIATVADVFDYVYGKEVGAMGYRPPPVTRYDVYVRDMTVEDAYGVTAVDASPSYPATSSASYIEVDRAYTDPSFTDNGLYQPEQMLQVTAAHEFHHAIQYGYNYYLELWYAEATSAWMEDEVYDSVNQTYDYLPYYLYHTDTVALDAPLDGRTEYGRWIFNRYLSEKYSPSVVKEIWTKLAATSAPADVNKDIPMLPIIAGVLQEHGSTLSSDFSGLAKRLYLGNWSSHTAETWLIPQVYTKGDYAGYPADLSPVNQLIRTLPSNTFAYYRFLPASSAPMNLVLPFSSVPSTVEISAIRRLRDGSTQEYPLDRSSGTVTVPSFNAAGTAEVVLVISKSYVDPPASSGSSSSKSGCFIATAAYGSYLHPKVAELRAFRDRHLLTNAAGRLFVAGYYRISPPIAEFIGRHEVLRALTRWALTPVFLCVEHPGVLLLLLVVSVGYLLRRGLSGITVGATAWSRRF